MMDKDKPDSSLDKTQYAIFSGKASSDKDAQKNEYNSIKQSHPYPFLNPASSNKSLGLMGQYEIIEILGEGGMGFVFKAEDMQLHRVVALKVMKPVMSSQASAKERFLHEARSMASIKSDNVAIIHQVGEQHDVPYLAMEFLKGQSMAQWIRTTDITPVETIIKWAIEICDGLTPAHEQNLIHRDIKPANLWIEAPDNRIKILDFGLAYAMESDTQLTQTGHIIGTLEYMAPELFESTKANAKTDLFSLGCVLYTLASNASPFAGNSQLSVIKNIAAARPKPLQKIRPDIPYSLNQLISQLLSKDPDRRPGSAKEVSLRLQEIRQQIESESKHAQHAPPQSANHANRTAHTTSVSNLSQKKSANSRFLFRFSLLALVVAGYFFYQSDNSRIEPPVDHSTAANMPLPIPPRDIEEGRPLDKGPASEFVGNQDAVVDDLFPQNSGFEPDEELEAELDSDAAGTAENVPPDGRPQDQMEPGYNPDNMQVMPPEQRFERGMYPPPPGYPPPEGYPPPFRPPPKRLR